MGLIYGVESTTPANTRLTNGYLLYDWVVRKSCYPSFWGRNITGPNAIANKEISFLREKQCKIALIVRDLLEPEICGNRDAGSAARAIAAAKELGVPQNQGIALFAYIPPNWGVNHNWMIHYAHILTDNGFVPGFIGNTDSSKNFNFDRQCSHYLQATRSVEQYHAAYWSTEPKYSFDPEIWVPYAPSAFLPKDMHIWTYGTVNFHSLHVNKCYLQDVPVIELFY